MNALAACSLHRILYISLGFALLTVLAFFAFTGTPARASTTINVNSTSDVIANDGKCTLREAVIAANNDTASGAAIGECSAGSGPDTILLPAGTYVLTRTGTGEDLSATGDLDIRQALTIQGAGTACSSPPHPNCTIINGNAIDRIFDITTTVPFTISKIEIASGSNNADCGGGIRNFGNLIMSQVLVIANYASWCGGGLFNVDSGTAQLNTVSFGNNTAHHGGAIFNGGTISLTRVSLTFDTATSYGGGMVSVGNAILTDMNISYETAGTKGGGIVNGGILTMTRSTLNNNSVSGGDGGAIVNEYKIWITNTTVSTNTASTGKGGGIYNMSYYGSALANVTLKNNAASQGGNIYRDTTGGKNGLLNIQNTIVDDGVSGGNCGGSAITSRGYNLESANSCGFTATGDITNTSPLLGPLASNGGVVETHALLVGSPAINKIPFGTNGCGTTITTDARGYARIAPCDIGAFEYVLRFFLPLIRR